MDRRFRRRRRWRAVIIAGAIGVLVAIRGCVGGFLREDSAPVDEPLVEGDYQVTRVIDGDTIVVADKPISGTPPSAPSDAKQVRVRLIGIDAPESVTPDHPVEPFGPEAAEFAREFLVGGTATLRFDRTKLDKYKRWRAYVFVNERMLNEELVREGLARADHYRGDNASLANRIRKAEAEAREAARGRWAARSSP